MDLFQTFSKQKNDQIPVIPECFYRETHNDDTSLSHMGFPIKLGMTILF